MLYLNTSDNQPVSTCHYYVIHTPEGQTRFVKVNMRVNDLSLEVLMCELAKGGIVAHSHADEYEDELDQHTEQKAFKIMDSERNLLGEAVYYISH